MSAPREARGPRRPAPRLSATGGRILTVALLVASSGFLAGSYCSERGYYTLGGAAAAGQLASGPVARFGSVFVDGAEYATTSATVTLDGVTVAESALLPGQLVVVTGTPGSGGTAGTATSVVATTSLVGPVTAVDLAAHTLTVLSQTVQITGDTSVGAGIAPTEVGGLPYGQVLAIDGYRTASGFIASRLDPALGVVSARITGRVSALLGATQTFSIGGTVVSYGAVTGGVPAGLADGAFVVVTGTVGGAATLNAQQLRVQPEATAGASGSAGILHGAVTRYGSATDFDVAGQPVSSSATRACCMKSVT